MSVPLKSELLATMPWTFLNYQHNFKIGDFQAVNLYVYSNLYFGFLVLHQPNTKVQEALASMLPGLWVLECIVISRRCIHSDV